MSNYWSVVVWTVAALVLQVDAKDCDALGRIVNYQTGRQVQMCKAIRHIVRDSAWDRYNEEHVMMDGEWHYADTTVKSAARFDVVDGTVITTAYNVAMRATTCKAYKYLSALAKAGLEMTKRAGGLDDAPRYVTHRRFGMQALGGLAKFLNAYCLWASPVEPFGLVDYLRNAVLTNLVDFDAYNTVKMLTRAHDDFDAAVEVMCSHSQAKTPETRYEPYRTLTGPIDAANLMLLLKEPDKLPALADLLELQDAIVTAGIADIKAITVAWRYDTHGQ